MATDVDTLASALAPLLAVSGLDLYDLELGQGLVKITVTTPDGVTMDELATANRVASAYLDEHEPFERRYTLEVSSPGVERPLRTPAHFAAALGEGLKLKVDAEVVAERRVDGTLAAVDEDGIVVNTDSGDLAIRYEQIERARTTFNWGAAAKPSPSRAGAPRGQRRSLSGISERITTP